MSNTDKPLTAESYIRNHKTYIILWLHPWGPHVKMIQDAMQDYAAQQTAALRKELELAKLKVKNAEWQEEQNSTTCQALIRAAAKERDQAKEELEAVKKERDDLREKYNKELQFSFDLTGEKVKLWGEIGETNEQLSEVTRQRDEAVKNTVELCRKAFAAGMNLEESGGRGRTGRGFIIENFPAYPPGRRSQPVLNQVSNGIKTQWNFFPDSQLQKDNESLI